MIDNCHKNNALLSVCLPYHFYACIYFLCFQIYFLIVQHCKTQSEFSAVLKITRSFWTLHMILLCATEVFSKGLNFFLAILKTWHLWHLGLQHNAANVPVEGILSLRKHSHRSLTITGTLVNCLLIVYLQFSYDGLVLDTCPYQNVGYLPHITGQLRLTFVLHAVVACDYIWTALMIDCKTTDSIICRESKLSSHDFNFGFTTATKLLVLLIRNTL